MSHWRIQGAVGRGGGGDAGDAYLPLRQISFIFM